MPNNRGKPPSGSLGALDDQMKIFWYGDTTLQQWQLPTLWEHGHSRKNTTQNQRPARLTHLGKNKGFPANQKGSGKNKGWNEKNLYTRQVENLKRRLGQKMVFRWIENPKGRSRKKLGIKSVTLCLIGSLHIRNSASTIWLRSRHRSINFIFNQAAKWWEAWRHKGDSRVGTQWDCSHSCFVSFFKL